MLPYIGGKSRLANWIISNFPEDYQQKSYCEVFGGGGWVLFKKEPSHLETYNDLNKNLVNLFRIIRDNYKEFEHKAQWSLHSREMYIEAKEKLKNDEFFNDLERAVQYALEKVQAFASSNFGSWGYAVNVPKIYAGKWAPFIKRIELINARLKKVQIECLNYEKCIEKYDGKNTIFYLDPPYVMCENYYNIGSVNFGISDHHRLAEILKNIQGKFVLSYYKHSLITQLYSDYNIQSKSAVKSACGSVGMRKGKPKPKSVELLIKNY